MLQDCACHLDTNRFMNVEMPSSCDSYELDRHLPRTSRQEHPEYLAMPAKKRCYDAPCSTAESCSYTLESNT